MNKGICYIGTSGWSYKHWKGIFYPEKLPSRQYLEFYIKNFNCIELNASFYRLPTEKTILSWRNTMPEGFRVVVKLNRQITHFKRLKNTEEELRTFIDLFSPLYNLLGPFLIQLPPSMKFDPVVVEEFYSHLRKEYAQFKFAIEPRHESWFNDIATGLAKNYSIIWTIADSGGRYPQKITITADSVYLRFHGPENPTQTGYSIEELSFWADKTKKWLSNGLDVWVFFNNDGYGHAIYNARSFIELTGNENQLPEKKIESAKAKQS
jgi:uncharacterized protein YecE (DUF72 family)